MLIVERDYKIEARFMFLVLSVDDGACEGTLGDSGRTDEVGRCVFVGARRCVPDSWDRGVSPGYIAPPDVSDSDGYRGAPGSGIFHFSQFPWRCLPLRRDKRRRRGVS